MDDLAAFLKARLDEREAVAKLAAREGGTWTQDDPVRYPGAISSLGGPVVYDEGAPDENQAPHIALNDPNLILREVEAKRAIIGEQTSDHAPIESDYGLTCRTCVAWQDDEGAHEFGIAIPEAWPCKVARALTAVYSDHPDYRPEWKP